MLMPSRSKTFPRTVFTVRGVLFFVNIPYVIKDRFFARIHMIYNIDMIYPHYLFFFHRMNKEKTGFLVQIAKKAPILGLFDGPFWV